MLRFVFKRGLKVHSGLKAWVLQKRLPNGQLYFETENGEALNVSEKEFYQNYQQQKWIIDREGLIEGKAFYEAAPRDLQSFSEKRSKQAVRRLEYINAIERSGARFISTPSQLKPLIQSTGERLNDPKPPSPISVYRWYRRFMNGKSAVHLVDQNERKGRRQTLNGERLALLQEVIDEVYLNPQKHPVTAVYRILCGRINQMNASRPQLPKLQIPSKATIYRYINSFESYSVDVARLGKAAADRRYSTVMGEQKSDRLLERWEIDHTPLDLILVLYLENGMHTIGRPWITVILDKYSRMVMGFYISLHTPSAQSVMNCLKHAILPKEEFMSQFEDIHSEWPAHGLPETLVCDNGMDLHAGSIESVCMELGIQVQFCPAKSPKYKGAIERFFRRLNEELIHTLPGTVFSNPKQRGDYPSERLACIDMETLTHIVTKWTVDIYHQTPHKTIKTTPAAKWASGLGTRAGIELPADPQQLAIIMGVPAERALFHYGVEVNGLYYNSQPLQLIRRHYGQGIRVALKYYENDLGYIHVFDPIHKEYFAVPANKHQYANGLTLDQHEAINRLLRERSNEGRENDFERREELRTLICKAQRNRKMAMRKKGAVLAGIDSERPVGRVRRKPIDADSQSHDVAPKPPIPDASVALPPLKVISRLNAPHQEHLWEDDYE